MTISTEELWTLARHLRERLLAEESVVLDQKDVRRLFGRDIALDHDITKLIVGRVVDLDPGLVVSTESFIVLEGDAKRALSLILACRDLGSYYRRVANIAREAGFEDGDIAAHEMNMTGHLPEPGGGPTQH